MLMMIIYDAQVTGDLPGHPSHHQQSINHRHHAAAACKRMVGCMSVFPPCVTDFFARRHKSPSTLHWASKQAGERVKN